MDQASKSRTSPAVDLGGDRADLLFEVLAHPYRRFVLWYLWEARGRANLDRLAREIEAWQPPERANGRGVSGRATIALTLRHTHLPKLAEADMVEFDRNAAVLRDGATDALVHLAEVVEE